MPPQAPIIDKDTLATFMSGIENGHYHMTVCSDFDPVVPIEGASYFQFRDKVFVVWKQE